MFGHRPNTLARGIKRVLGDNAVGSLEPRLSFDFTQNRYSTVGGTKSLSSALTHVRNGNATMVDSDGLLKWAPHNLLTYSEDFTQSDWQKLSLGTGSAPIVTANAEYAPDGTQTASRVQMALNGGTTSGDQSDLRNLPSYGSSGVSYTVSVWVKSYDGISYDVLIDFNGTEVRLYTVTSSWQKISTTITTLDTTARPINIRLRGNTGTSDSADILIWGAHAYRSDLGGMVDNPDRGDSYVPTTSSAVYLPRIGHHEYNGYEWVDKGLLAESEARTNLVEYSEPDSRSSTNSAREWLFSDLDPATEIANVLGPDGVSDSARSCSLASGGGFDAYVYQIPVTSGAYYTVSCYVKLGTATNFALHINDTTAWDSVVDGYKTFTSSDGLNTETFERISLTFVAPASNKINVHIGRHSSGTQTQQDQGTVILYGFQFETGSVPSSYIPTSGSTVTRAAETFTVPSVNIAWPLAEVIGPELVTNGTFDTDTSGWTALNATLESIGGELVVTGDVSGAYPAANLSFTTTTGKVYRVTGVYRRGTSANLASVVVKAPTNITTIISNNTTSNEEFEVVFVAPTTTATLALFEYATSSAGGTVIFDNISVREINPLSVSIQMKGEMDYSDEDSAVQQSLFYWYENNDANIRLYLDTSSTRTGSAYWIQDNGTERVDFKSGATDYSPGLNVPFDIASRHGSTFINGAVDGVALTADTTPTALPDLSSTDLSLAYDFMGTISEFRVWNQDLGDSGLEEATEPSTEPTLSLTFDGQSSSFTDTGYLP